MYRRGTERLLGSILKFCSDPSKSCHSIYRQFSCTPGHLQPRGSRYGTSDIRRQTVVKEDENHVNKVESKKEPTKLSSPKQHTPAYVIQGKTAASSKVKKLLEESMTSELKDVRAEYPSDGILVKEYQRYQEYSRDQTRHAYKPPIDPRDTSIMFFPGQGSQFVGMAKRLLKFPNVPEMFDIASKILGYNLLDICLNGPKSELDKTLHCQPAIYVTSLAAIEALREENPKAIENCVGCAGFSIGEYAALAFAGSMSFEDGLQIVKVRARAMQEASEATPSGMMTVFLGPDNKCNFACHTARLYCLKKLKMENPICHVANYLYPECKVIAGHVEALEFLENNGRDFGIRRYKRLPVSGAFHTKLMKPACKPLENALKNMKLKRPLVPVYSNVTARQMSLQGQIKRLLVEQIKEPVKWEQIMQTICARPQGEAFPMFYEAGPGKQLGALLKMTNSKAHHQYYPIEV